MALIAMDEVRRGRELTISYGSRFSADARVSHAACMAARAERRRRLWERFGFRCRCERCGEEGESTEGEEEAELIVEELLVAAARESGGRESGGSGCSLPS